MTRQKKSRNPGVAPNKSAKDADKKKLLETSDKKPKKHSGKKAGNRQQEARKKPKTLGAAVSTQDPRIGSKKPIDLGVKVTKPNLSPTNKKQVERPLAAIKIIDNSDDLAQQLDDIENDSVLQKIINKQDAEQPLTETEVDYFNDKMEQHRLLSEKLGLDDDDNEEDINSAEENDDALWDKLDNNNLSEFD